MAEIATRWGYSQDVKFIVVVKFHTFHPTTHRQNYSEPILILVLAQTMQSAPCTCLLGHFDTQA